VISPDEWSAHGDFAVLRGRRIFFRREGSGTPLLLIHGYPTSSWDWAPIWPELVARFDVIAMDMLGFGESEKPTSHRYSLIEQADLHEALLARLGVARYHVLAHDYGVTVGQELLARAAPLDSIAFLNGGLFPETHRARPIQKLLASPLGPVIAKLSNERTFRRSFTAVFGTPPSEEELRGFWTLASKDDGMIALARLIRYIAERRERRERWVGALIAATLPLVVINGSVDPVSGEHMVRRLLALRPTTQVVRLPGVGHYPQVEAPRAVLDAYLAFRSADA
jgi:pimeloyl-ACP methyl ester carboxylesterase